MIFIDNMVIVTGLPLQSRSSEVYGDLSGSVTSCGSIGDYGTSAWGTVGGYLESDQVVMVCGGQNSNQCYSLPDGKQTQMSQPRQYAAAVAVENGLWVTGGENSDMSEMSSTEIVSFNREFSGMTADLPVPLTKHCAVILKSKNSAMIIGGTSNGQESAKTYFYDFATQAFTEGPAMSTARSSHMCASFSVNGKEKVAVVGGRDKNSVEIFDVASNTWTSGNYHPKIGCKSSKCFWFFP